jgi:hypothetical protein
MEQRQVDLPPPAPSADRDLTTELLDAADASPSHEAFDASPSREAFDAARKALHESLSPRSSDDGASQDDTLQPLPDGPPALSGAPMALPLDLRSSPLSSPEQSPDGPQGGHTSFRAAASASGVNAPISLAFVSPHRGTQRRRGLLAACATPRSSTPRLMGEEIDEHASALQLQRPMSALLDGLITPVADTLSGGVEGLYQWPVTYSRRPEPAPPRERERLRITLQCWLGSPPALPALPARGKGAETAEPPQAPHAETSAGWGEWLLQFVPQAAEPRLHAVPSLERLNEL